MEPSVEKSWFSFTWIKCKTNCSDAEIRKITGKFLSKFKRLPSYDSNMASMSYSRWLRSCMWIVVEQFPIHGFSDIVFLILIHQSQHCYKKTKSETPLIKRAIISIKKDGAHLRGLVTSAWMTSSSTVSTLRSSVGRRRDRCSWISCCSSPSPVLAGDHIRNIFFRAERQRRHSIITSWISCCSSPSPVLAEDDILNIFFFRSWKAETTFHYCWGVKSSLKLVWNIG